jgi:ribose transport system permease protein
MANTTMSAPAPASPAPVARRTRPFSLPGRGILLANVVLIFVAVVILNVDLFGRGSLSTLTPVIGVMVLMALGQAFIIGTGGIDLSIPSTVTLVGVIVLKGSGGEDGRLVSTLLTVLAACLLIGLVNGVLVEVLHLNALVVTLASGQLIAGFTRIYRGPVLAVSTVPEALSNFARNSVFEVSAILVFAVGISVVVALWLRYHVSGRTVSASSVARAAADYSGLAATRQRIVAWVVGTVIVGVGAVLLAGQISTPDLTLGDPYLLTTVVAVVLGGASIAGGRVKVAATMLGALFIMLLEHVFRVRGFSSGVSLVVEGLVLAVGLALVATSKNVRWLTIFARREGTAGSATDLSAHHESQE